MVQNQYKCDAILRVNKNVPIVESSVVELKVWGMFLQKVPTLKELSIWIDKNGN